MISDTLIQILQKRGFQVTSLATKNDARDYILSQCEGKTVGMGGSVTLTELALYDTLQDIATPYWHAKCPGADTMLSANKAQIYLTSANGIAETGEIINIDGHGNRISSTLFTHEKVLYVIGVNKIAPDYQQAMHRARNIAGPRNAKRLKKNTPCARSAVDRCFDCNSPERICRGFLTITHPLTAHGATEIVFVDEPLGY